MSIWALQESIVDKVKQLEDVGICIKSTFKDINKADVEQL